MSDSALTASFLFFRFLSFLAFSIARRPGWSRRRMARESRENVSTKVVGSWHQYAVMQFKKDKPIVTYDLLFSQGNHL